MSFELVENPLDEAVEEALAQGLTLAQAMARFEARVLAGALRRHEGNRQRAMHALQCPRASFFRKCSQYQLAKQEG